MVSIANGDSLRELHEEAGLVELVVLVSIANGDSLRELPEKGYKVHTVFNLFQSRMAIL